MLFAAKWDSFSNSVIAVAGEKENRGQVLVRPKNKSLDEPLQVKMEVTSRSHAFFASAVSEDARSAAFGSSDGTVQICDLREH
mmetsp:Transcript_4099/g.5790  ORF Transcript_4099/g.5790 Transcript_4099/m.5790 type:complete len:83 (+) Transcript_4099:2-250(+)